MCLIVAGPILLALITPARPVRTEPLRTSGGKIDRVVHSSNAQIYADIGLALGLTGAIILLIDAFKRQYESPKALPIGFALVGLLTFGLTSLIYYVIWGWAPGRPSGDPAASQFCAACLQATLDKPAPATATVNGLVGTRLMGMADRCPKCGSSVKTLWLMLLLPIIPFASYRILPVGKVTFNRASYVGRKMPRMNWGQVWPILSMLLAIVAYIAILELW